MKKQRRQQPALFDIGGSKPVQSGHYCERCNLDFYPNELNVVQASGQWTKHCPQCHAVIEQRKSGAFKKECNELMSALSARSCTTDAAFSSLAGFSIQPAQLPWLWLATVCPKITEACEVLVAESRDSRRRLNRIKAKATSEFKKCNPNQTRRIAKARRDFVEALRLFCRGLELNRDD